MTNLYSCFFQLEFPEENDEFYISLTHPYTYSWLNSLLDQIWLISFENIQIWLDVLTLSLLGNKVPILYINSTNNSPNKISIISARVHPGETLSSHVMETIIDSLILNPW